MEHVFPTHFNLIRYRGYSICCHSSQTDNVDAIFKIMLERSVQQKLLLEHEFLKENIF